MNSRTAGRKDRWNRSQERLLLITESRRGTTGDHPGGWCSRCPAERRRRLPDRLRDGAAVVGRRLAVVGSYGVRQPGRGGVPAPLPGRGGRAPRAGRFTCGSSAPTVTGVSRRSILATGSDGHDQESAATYRPDWATRVTLPVWLDLAKGHGRCGAGARASAPIVDRASWRTSRDIVSPIRAEMWRLLHRAGWSADQGADQGRGDGGAQGERANR